MDNQIEKPSAPVLSPEGLRSVLREMPDYREEMELDYLHEQVGNIENREALARRIAHFVHEQQELYSNLPQEEETLIASILAQLDGLAVEIDMEKEELLRKTEKFEEIERDPEKKALLSRALDVVKKGWNFTWKHKWKILAVLAVLATGVAAWYYWEELMALLNWKNFGFGAKGAAEAVGGAEAVAEGVAATGGVPLELAVEEGGYLLKTAEGYQSVTLDQIVEMAKTATPNEDGLVAQWVLDKTATAGAEADLYRALEGAIKPEQFRELSGFVENLPKTP